MALLTDYARRSRFLQATADAASHVSTATAKRPTHPGCRPFMAMSTSNAPPRNATANTFRTSNCSDEWLNGKGKPQQHCRKRPSKYGGEVPRSPKNSDMAFLCRRQGPERRSVSAERLKARRAMNAKHPLPTRVVLQQARSLPSRRSPRCLRVLYALAITRPESRRPKR